MKKLVWFVMCQFWIIILLVSVDTAFAINCDTDGDGVNESVSVYQSYKIRITESDGSDPREYYYSSGYNLGSYLYCKNMDGDAGKEVIAEWNDGVSKGIYIQRDQYPHRKKSKTFTAYNGDLNIVEIIDHDGDNADDIVATSKGYLSMYPEFIHIVKFVGTDRNVPLNKAISAWYIDDLDWIPGAEICYQWSFGGSNGYEEIIRLAGPDTVNDCEPLEPPVISVSPTTNVNFGNVEVGTSSDPISFNVSNQGQALIYFYDIIFNTDDFEFQSSTCFENTPTGGCQINVVFHPTSLGSKSATLTLHTNDPSHQSVYRSMQGVGIEGPGGGGGGSGTPDISYSPLGLGFANISVWTITPIQTITVTNNGTADLDITSVSVTGADALEFIATDDCPSSLSPSSYCHIDVSFAPTSGGSKYASVHIVSNDPDSPSLYANVQGEGNWGVLVPIINLLLQ